MNEFLSPTPNMTLRGAVRRARPFALVPVVLFSVSVLGCSPSSSDGPSATTPSTGGAGNLPDDGSPRPSFCSRPGDDAVRAIFCANGSPGIASLADLQAKLPVAPDPYHSAPGITPSVLAHSTALEARVVSPINPRVIVSSIDANVFMAFQRGTQQVEIAARGRDDFLLNFYLLTFRQACNDATVGCIPGDLYTPSIESSWTDVAVQDDEDLKNTAFDCRQCHQRAREAPVLLMRELEAPWTHFFGPLGVPDDPGYQYGINGGVLTWEYGEAKGDEDYGGVSRRAIQNTIGFALETLVDAPQALLFDSPAIMRERFPDTGGAWPGSPLRSKTWDDEFAAFKRGEHLALPYFDAQTTDPAKLATLTSAYQGYLSGSTSAADLPDFSDIFPDDPQTRAEIGLETEPNATPAEALVQACGSCHNDVLDQSLTRARFNVGVGRLDRAELDIALERLQRASDSPGAMPPAQARHLTDEVRGRLVDYLRQGDFPPPDQTFLNRAAASGMAGTAQKPTTATPPPSDPGSYDNGGTPKPYSASGQ
jgi:hypothetical protein